MDEERREDPRHELAGQFKGWPLEPLEDRASDADQIEGSLRNISAGGLQVETSSRIATSTPIRSEVRFSQMPVPVRLLVQLRWVSEQPHQGRYLAGFEFLL